MVTFIQVYLEILDKFIFLEIIVNGHRDRNFASVNKKDIVLP